MPDQIPLELRIPRAKFTAAAKKAEEEGIKIETFIIRNMMGGGTKEVVREVIKEVQIPCDHKDEQDNGFKVKKLWNR